MAGTKIAFILFWTALVGYTVFAVWHNLKMGRTIWQIISDAWDELF